MTPGGPAGTLDVAHEARARRWWHGERDGELLLDHAELTTEPPERGQPRVGPGGVVRVAVLGAPDATLEAAARRALLASGAEVALWLRSNEPSGFAERAAALRSARADLVVVLAGDPRHADAVVLLCESFRAGCADQSPAPRAVVAGDARTTMRLHGPLAPFGVEVLPDPRRGDGHAALCGRVQEFRRGTESALILRDLALGELARALAAVANAEVLLVDVAGATTSLVQGSPGGRLIALHAGGFGVGRGADRIVARAGLDRVRRWIPRAIDAPGLLERVFNRARWPDAVSAEPLALLLEMALAREAVAHLLEDAAAAGLDVAALRRSPVLALTGRPADLPRAAQSLLVALDAVQPIALCSILRDADDALVAIGARIAQRRAAGDDPAPAWAAAELGRRHRPLALVAPLERSAKLRIVGAAGRRDERVERGDFRLLPLEGTLELTARGTRGRGVAGSLGLLIDARGRPLGLPPRDAERIPTVARWFAALDALPPEVTR